MNLLCIRVALVIAFLGALGCAFSQKVLDIKRVREYAQYTNDPINLRSTRIVKRQTPLQNGATATGTTNAVTAAANSMMAGWSRVAAHLPQFFVEGRHYWPTQYSLTKQFGLQGINELIGEVVRYERSRALAAARESSCRQRDNCLWNQRFTMVSTLFGPMSEEQRLMQKIDCNSVFAGCQGYH
ncbi:uncharacterized protein LOC111272690 [Varroa jacobsoni]|uniref:uncharacterized protein LOC111272690 n=1 Tax=Varroa jacobsoni TaxID=62625 RepID=UPI000BFA0B31|nr:uncharacterized protein LOC111272690 [Varroa jacobsoni]